MRTNLIPAFISPGSSQSYHSQQSPHSLNQYSSSSAQNIAPQIVSYDRMGSSEDSTFRSMSQATTHSRTVDETLEGQSRSQIRFQEFIARSRHLESLEILHDIKKRMIFIEELSVAQNHKLSEQFQQLQQKVETDATRAINLTIQANNAQNSIIVELRNRLDSYQISFERLERKLGYLEEKVKSIPILPVHYEQSVFAMFSQEEGMNLEEYLTVKKGSFTSVAESSCYEISSGFDLALWNNNGDLETDHHHRKGYIKEMQEETKDDRAEVIDVEPWMTITRKIPQEM